MTVRLASAMCGDTPIELRVEDRLQSLAIPIRGMSTAMIGILIGSIAVHVLLVATTLVSGWAPPSIAPREISVEIVQEPPKAPAAAPKPEPAKLEKPQAEAGKIEAPKPPPAAPKPPPAAPRLETAAKPVAAKPIEPPAQPKPAAAESAQDTKALEAELASLRAEQAALKASEATTDQNGAGQAIAMPSIGGDGDAVGYQQLVFSQLAKAKGDAEYHGKSGVAGIRFEMDQAGQLVRAEVVSPSGDPALDAKALDIVHRAAPFPPPPTEADRFVFANVNFIAPKSQ